MREKEKSSADLTAAQGKIRKLEKSVANPKQTLFELRHRRSTRSKTHISNTPLGQ